MAGIDIKPDAQGKVRDLYDLGDKLLLVASDRISAFDYILEDEIPWIHASQNTNSSSLLIFSDSPILSGLPSGN